MGNEGGFIMMEVIIAMAFFAITATAFVTALQRVSQVAILAEEEVAIARVIDSAMIDALSRPFLEEGEESKSVAEFGELANLEVKTVILPIDFLETDEGELLDQMFRIEIVASWRDGSDIVERKANTWRYAQMYRPE